MYMLNTFPLAPQPHINTLAKHFCFHRPSVRILLYNFRCGESIKHCLNGWTSVLKANLLQLTTIHELYPFAEFALLEAFSVGDLKMLVRNMEPLDAIYPVNRGKQIVRVLKFRCSVNVSDKCYPGA